MPHWAKFLYMLHLSAYEKIIVGDPPWGELPISNPPPVYRAILL